MRNNEPKQHRKWVTAALALLVAAGTRGLAQDMPSRFEVASVKLSSPETLGSRFSAPGAMTFTASGARLLGLIGIPFGVSDLQVAGLPRWEESTRYDVEAKPEGNKPLEEGQFRQAMQQLLKERLYLSVHHETRMSDGYQLVAGKGTAKLRAGQGDRESRIYFSDEGLDAANTSLVRLCSALQMDLRFPVADATGIKGNFEIKLRFAKQEDSNSALPSVFTAVQEQLGLKLERAKVPLDMIVIDHVDREPTEN